MEEQRHGIWDARNEKSGMWELLYFLTKLGDIYNTFLDIPSVAMFDSFLLPTKNLQRWHRDHRESIM